MHLDNVAHDGQADAQASILASGGRVGLSKPIEDVWQKFGLDAYAAVFDRNLDLTFGASDARLYSPSFARELDCVREQVPDGLLQTVGVAEDHAVRRFNRFAQDDSFGLGARPDDIYGGMKDAIDHDRLGVELEASG